MAYWPKLRNIHEYPHSTKVITLFRATLCFVFPITVIAQTFSPYTPKKIQEFNNQPIAPTETPASPVYLEPPPVRQKPNASIDSRYIKIPIVRSRLKHRAQSLLCPLSQILVPSPFSDC